MVKKRGILALTHWAIMENVTFFNFFEIVTCGMFSDIAALFLAGSLLLPGTLGEEKDGKIEERPGRNTSFYACQILEPRLCLSASHHSGSVCLSDCCFYTCPHSPGHCK